MGDKFTGLCEQPVLATESASSKEDISPHSTACIRKNAGRDCLWRAAVSSRRWVAIGETQERCPPSGTGGGSRWVFFGSVSTIHPRGPFNREREARNLLVNLVDWESSPGIRAGSASTTAEPIDSYNVTGEAPSGYRRRY